VCASQDRPALAQLFVAWSGLEWLNRTHWCSSQPLGTWHGVTTDGVGSRSSSGVGSSGGGGSAPRAAIGGDGGAAGESVHGRVTQVYLGGNGLAGRLHDGAPGLEALHKLTKLSLFGNFLSGAVSSSLATLPRLNYLDLEANDRLAHVPPFGRPLECKTVSWLLRPPPRPPLSVEHPAPGRRARQRSV
jgi:hypothetical protein